MDLLFRTRTQRGFRERRSRQESRSRLHQRRPHPPERQERRSEVRRQDGEDIRELSALSSQLSALSFQLSVRGSRSPRLRGGRELFIFSALNLKPFLHSICYLRPVALTKQLLGARRRRG